MEPWSENQQDEKQAKVSLDIIENDLISDQKDTTGDVVKTKDLRNLTSMQHFGRHKSMSQEEEWPGQPLSQTDFNVPEANVGKSIPESLDRTDSDDNGGTCLTLF